METTRNLLKQMKFLFIAAIVAVLFITGCSKKPSASRELTRELATQLLNNYLASPHIKNIDFIEGEGLNNAKRDGIVVLYQGKLPEGASLLQQVAGVESYLMFSDKGAAFSDSISGRRLLRDNSVELRSPIAERVREVTGIALSPFPNICEVEYTTEYLVPKCAQPLFKYIYSGRNTKSTFQKFDDGWRIVQQGF